LIAGLPKKHADAFGSFVRRRFVWGERMETFSNWWKFLLLPMGLVLCFAGSVNALDVTLQWDANEETNLAGYKIYYRAGSSGGGLLGDYNGTGANEGDSPIEMILAQDENSDPDTVEFTVSNLTNGLTYFFVVTAYDNEVPVNESGPSNEADTTPFEPDETPPVVSNVQVSAKTRNSAVIVWTTDEPSHSEVQYGTAGSTWNSYPYNETDAGLTTSHSITLSSLSENTTYYFRVGSTDGAGNGPTTSGEASFTTLDDILVSDVSVVSGEAYTVVENGLEAGALVYIDRDYTFSSIPAFLESATYIRTANNDKSSIGDEFMSFELSDDATVYVAHDDRITTKPSWMDSFTDTGQDIVTTDADFSVFAKDCAAGTVMLGGNDVSSEGSYKSMYSVIIVGENDSGPEGNRPAGLRIERL
jgi:hypothetical protein